MAAEAAVVAGYANRLRERAGGAGTWIIDVRPRADLKPVYYLIFATRHVDGMVAFGNSSSLGLERWRKSLAQASAEDTLFSDAAEWEADWKDHEAKLKANWVETLRDRPVVDLHGLMPTSAFDHAGLARGRSVRGGTDIRLV